MNYKDLTIIIPTLVNERSNTANKLCIDSLAGTCMSNIIVAPNGEGSRFPQGQCAAVNRAAKEVKTDWMMVSNNDMIYPSGWFLKLVEAVDNFSLLVASPNLVEPKKGAPPFLEKFCGGIGVEGSKPDFDKECFFKFVENYKEHENRPEENVIEDGFNLPFIVRKDVFEEIGMYDSSFDPWGSCSDTDLQAKIMYAGIIPKRVRSVLVYHFGMTSGTFHPRNEAFKHENWRYFERKWGFPSWTNDQGVWYKPEFPKEIVFKADWKDKYAS